MRFFTEDAAVPTLHADALVDIDEVKAYTRQKDDEFGDMLIELANRVSGQVYKFLGRRPFLKTYTNETHSGDGTAELLLDQWPPKTVTAVRELRDNASTRTLDITNYRVSSRGVLWLPRDVFGVGFRNIQVDYQAGYEAAVHDMEIQAIKLATLRWIQVAFQDWRDGVGRGTGFTVGGQSVSLIETPIPVDVRAALIPFRRFS